MKSIKEEFAKVLESPDRVDFKNFLKSNVGELDFVDFKKEWCAFSKIARHILAMANSKGGIIIIGVEETSNNELIPSGIKQVKDKADIKQFGEFKKWITIFDKNRNVSIKDYLPEVAECYGM